MDIEPEFWRTLNGVLVTDKGRALLSATRCDVILAAQQTLGAGLFTAAGDADVSESAISLEGACTTGR